MDKIYNKTFDETYYKETLTNDLRVIIFHKPDFLTTTACFVTPYGSLNINQSFNNKKYKFHPGIAHFLEHKLFESNGSDVLNEFAKYGAEVNASTSYDETVYYFSKSSKDIEDSLNLLLDFVQNLDITENSVNKEKGIIIEELSMYQQNADVRLIDETFKSLYKYYPLNNDIGGDADSVNAITKEELEECYRINYHPSNMVFIVTTPLDPEYVMKLIRLNQASKIFTKQEKPIEDNEKEPEEVVRKYYEFKMDVAKGKTCYAIKLKPNFVDDLDAHIKEAAVVIYLSCYFSTKNPNYQKWLEEGLINDYFGYDVNFNKKAASIIFYSESDDKDSLKKLIDEELKKDLIDEEMINQIKRRLIGKSFSIFNDIESFTLGYAKDYVNNVDYFNSIEELKKLNKDTIVKIFESFDLSNYALIHISPLNNDK